MSLIDATSHTENVDSIFDVVKRPDLYQRHGLYVSNEYNTKAPLQFTLCHAKPVHNFTRKVAVAVDRAYIMAKDQSPTDNDIQYLLKSTAQSLNGPGYTEFFEPYKSCNVWQSPNDLSTNTGDAKPAAYSLILIEQSKQASAYEVNLSHAKKDSLPYVSAFLPFLPDFVTYIHKLGVYAMGQMGTPSVTFFNTELEVLLSLNSGCDLRKILYNPKNCDLITAGSEQINVWKLSIGLKKNGVINLQARSSIMIKVDQKESDYTVDAVIDARRQILIVALSNRLVMYSLENGSLVYAVDNMSIGRISCLTFSELFSFILCGTTKGKIGVCDSKGNLLHIFHHSNSPVLQLSATIFGDLIISASKFQVYFDSLVLFSEQYSYQAKEAITGLLGIDSSMVVLESEKSAQVLSFKAIFSSIARFDSEIVQLKIANSATKFSRLLTVFNDDVVRIISAETGQTETYQLPYFDVNNVKQFEISRLFNKHFVLLNSGEMWVVATDSHPCIPLDLWVASQSPLYKTTCIYLYESQKDNYALLFGGNAVGQLTLYNRYGGISVRMQLHREPIMQIDGDPDTQIICTISQKNILYICRVLVSSFNGISLVSMGSISLNHPVKKLSVSGYTVAVVFSDNALSMYRIDPYSGVATMLPSHIHTDDHGISVNCLSSIGKRGCFVTAGGSDNFLKIWDAASNILVRDIDFGTFTGPVVSDSSSGNILIASKTLLLRVKESSWLPDAETLDTSGRKTGTDFTNNGEFLSESLSLKETGSTSENSIAETSQEEFKLLTKADSLGRVAQTSENWDSIVLHALVRQWMQCTLGESGNGTLSQCNLTLFRDWRKHPLENVFETAQGMAYAALNNISPSTELKEMPDGLMTAEMTAIKQRLLYLKELHKMFVSKLAQSQIQISQLSKVRRSDPYLHNLSTLLAGTEDSALIQTAHNADISKSNTGLVEPPSPLIKRKKEVVKSKHELDSSSNVECNVAQERDDVIHASCIEDAPSKSILTGKQNVKPKEKSIKICLKNPLAASPKSARQNLPLNGLSMVGPTPNTKDLCRNGEILMKTATKTPQKLKILGKTNSAIDEAAGPVKPKIVKQEVSNLKKKYLSLAWKTLSAVSKENSDESKKSIEETNSRNTSSEFLNNAEQDKLQLESTVSSNDSLDVDSLSEPADNDRVQLKAGDNGCKTDENILESSQSMLKGEMSESAVSVESSRDSSLEASKPVEYNLSDSKSEDVEASVISSNIGPTVLVTDSATSLASNLDFDPEEIKTIGSIIEDNLETQLSVNITVTGTELGRRHSIAPLESRSEKLENIQNRQVKSQRTKYVAVPAILKPAVRKNWFPKTAFFRELTLDELGSSLAVTEFGLIVSDCEPNSVLQVLSKLVLGSLVPSNKGPKLEADERLEIFQYIFWMEFVYGFSNLLTLQTLVFEYLLFDPYSENTAETEQELRSSLMDLSLLFDDRPMELLTILLVYSISPFRVMRDKSHKILQGLGISRLKSDVLFEQVAYLFQYSKAKQADSAFSSEKLVVDKFHKPSASQIEMLWRLYQCAGSIIPDSKAMDDLISSKPKTETFKGAKKVSNTKKDATDAHNTNKNEKDDAFTYTVMPTRIHLFERLDESALIGEVDYASPLSKLNMSYMPLIPVIRLTEPIPAEILGSSFTAFLNLCIFKHLGASKKAGTALKHKTEFHSSNALNKKEKAVTASARSLENKSRTKRLSKSVSLLNKSVSSLDFGSESEAMLSGVAEDEVSVRNIYNDHVEKKLASVMDELVRLGWKPSNKKTKELLARVIKTDETDERNVEEVAFPTLENSILSKSVSQEPATELSYKDSISQTAELKTAQFSVAFKRYMYYRLIFLSMPENANNDSYIRLPQAVVALNTFIIQSEKCLIIDYVHACQEEKAQLVQLQTAKQKKEEEDEKKRKKVENMERYRLFKQKEEEMQKNLQRVKNAGQKGRSSGLKASARPKDSTLVAANSESESSTSNAPKAGTATRSPLKAPKATVASKPKTREEFGNTTVDPCTKTANHAVINTDGEQQVAKVGNDLNSEPIATICTKVVVNEASQESGSFNDGILVKPKDNAGPSQQIYDKRDKSILSVRSTVSIESSETGSLNSCNISIEKEQDNVQNGSAIEGNPQVDEQVDQSAVEFKNDLQAMANPEESKNDFNRRPQSPKRNNLSVTFDSPAVKIAKSNSAKPLTAPALISRKPVTKLSFVNLKMAPEPPDPDKDKADFENLKHNVIADLFRVTAFPSNEILNVATLTSSIERSLINNSQGLNRAATANRGVMPKTIVSVDNVSVGSDSSAANRFWSSKSTSDPRIARPWSSIFARNNAPRTVSEQLRMNSASRHTGLVFVPTKDATENVAGITISSQVMESSVDQEYEFVKNKGRAVKPANLAASRSSQSADIRYRSQRKYFYI